MFNYTFKIKNHYELNLNNHEIKITKETVKNDTVVFGKTWSAFYYNSVLDIEFKCWDFKTKKQAENWLIKTLKQENIL